MKKGGFFIIEMSGKEKRHIFIKFVETGNVDNLIREDAKIFKYRLDNLESAADFVIRNTQTNLWLLDAPMGAGKTTLAGKIIEKLTGQSFEGSPTFAIVREYESEEGKPVYHFDLYRLKDEEELWETGFEEYLDEDALIMIEWPALAESFIDRDFDRIRIHVNEDGSRTLEITTT